MSIAGFNESIWHFLGYLHIADAVARAEKTLDGATIKTITLDVIATVPPPTKPNLDVDDMTSRAVGIAEDTRAEVLAEINHIMHDLDDEFGAAHAMQRGVVSSPVMPRFAGAGAAGGSTTSSQRQIHVHYEDDAQQTLDSILQLNRMMDNDVVTSSGIQIWNGRSWSDTFASVETHAVIRELFGQAEAETPSSLATVAGTDNAADIAAFVAGRDHDRANGGTSDQPTVEPGRYVDGVLSKETPAAVDPLPELKGQKSAELVDINGETYSVVTGPSDGIGAAAYTGGNESTNAAVIKDLSGLNASIIIQGDAFISNAIIQVNVLIDNDHVELIANGPDELLQSLVQTANASGNVAHNIAEFVTHEYSTVLKGAAFTPSWTIDVVQGDFFSVHALTQINYLTDNDCVSQATETTFYALQTGQNQQVNLANVYGFDTYDIIIIGGDSHRANWIFQKNIILDSDWITSLMEPGEDAQQIADAGHNGLVNEAHISTYGNSEYTSINDSQRALMEAIARGDTVLAPNPDWHLAGSASGTLKVLYITGDCYDINLISQTNIVSDVDQVAQFATGEIAGAATGGNQAFNYAAIIDAGTLSGSCFLGGEAYEDCILIQANIVTDDNQISIQTADAYVPEVIAFTGSTDVACQSGDAPSAPVKVCDPGLLDSPGNVLN